MAERLQTPAYDVLTTGAGKTTANHLFDSIGHNLDTLRTLIVQGLHVDLVAGHDDIAVLDQALPKRVATVSEYD